MTLRSKKYLRFSRILLELLIIVIGILIALALDSWNQEREDRALSQEYMDRLVADIRSDVVLANQLLVGLESKSSSLAFLADLASDHSSTTSNPSAILQALPETLMLAFNAPSVRTATFDDMMSTGRLSLITSITLRDKVLEYYDLGTNSEQRLEGRMTRYPLNVFENVPPAVLSWYDITTVLLSTPISSQSSNSIEVVAEDLLLVSQWLSSIETQKFINAERNYTSQAVQLIEAGRSRALDLISHIESNEQ